MLAWKGLGGRSDGGKAEVTVEQIWGVVEENEKKRFAVRFVSDGGTGGRAEKSGRVDAVVALEETRDSTIATAPALSNTTAADSETADSETAQAISNWRAGTNTTTSQYFLRAVQGHSIATVTNDEALSPITLDEPGTIPETVVHGTFYASWPLILQSGGLKRMGRNCVHFATGPSVDEVLARGGGDRITMKAEAGTATETASEIEAANGDEGVPPNAHRSPPLNQVISGMRKDAQILIYIDLRECLEDIQTRKLDMAWYRSENGVVLTEGLVEESSADRDSAGEEELEKSGDVVEKKGRAGERDKERERIVPMRYVTKVVEWRRGLGVIWTREEGEVQVLPEELLGLGTPKGSGRGRGRGRGQRRGGGPTDRGRGGSTGRNTSSEAITP